MQDTHIRGKYNPEEINKSNWKIDFDISSSPHGSSTLSLITNVSDNKAECQPLLRRQNKSECSLIRGTKVVVPQSILANRESFKENPKGQSYCNSHYFNMAVATLVTLALENEHKKSFLTSSQKHSSHAPSKVKSPTHRIGELKTSGMVNFKQ